MRFDARNLAMPRRNLSAAALQAWLSPRLPVHLVGAMSSIKPAEIHRAESRGDILMPNMSLGSRFAHPMAEVDGAVSFYLDVCQYPCTRGIWFKIVKQNML